MADMQPSMQMVGISSHLMSNKMKANIMGVLSQKEGEVGSV